MRGYVDRIHSLGGELILVGNGTVSQAAQFRDEQGLETPVYTDPSRRSFDAAGLRHGLGSLFNPRVLLHGVAALSGGFRQSRTQGDPLQEGGAFVIGPGERVRFSYVSGEAGDHPDPDLLVAALGEQPASGQGPDAPQHH